MLFYSQIKKRFSQSDWRRGQTSYFNDCVEAVQLDGPSVSARVVIDGSETDSAVVSIGISRGTFIHSTCSVCPQTPCAHVAALCIWVVEKGSLLRAGLIENSTPRRDPTEDPRVPAVASEPVLFIRPVLENGVLTGIRLEAGIRYKNPKTKEKVVEGLHSLARDLAHSNGHARIWKNADDLRLKTTFDAIPILGSLDSPPIIHARDQALDNIVALLTNPEGDRIEFHPQLQTELDPEPLKLSQLRVGKRTTSGRLLSFEFRNSKIRLTSEQIAEVSERGLVTSRFIWPRDISKSSGGKVPIFRFGTPLTMIEKYANRSGILSPDKAAKIRSLSGYSTLEDDLEHPLHPIAVYRLSLELGVENVDVDSDWAEFHEWKRNFDKKKSPLLPKVPYGFDLREYQHNGLSWIWSLYHRRLAALLADEMGLGKTHQVLAFLSSIYPRRTGTRPKKKPVAAPGVVAQPKHLPTLVVAPTSVVAAWVQKLQKYDTGLRWYVFHGKDRVLDFDQTDLVLTTYGILQKEPSLRHKEWEVVILDEAQAIKNATTISSRASRILKSKFRIAMTGTPIENRSTDLWSVMEFLLPGFLGPLARFKRLYGAGYEAPTPAQVESLKRLVSPFLLRRTKSQVLTELPEKTEEIIYCGLTDIQKRLYEEYLDSKEANRIRGELTAKESKVDYAGILALLTRLKQVCDHPKLPALTSGKIKRSKNLNPAESGKWEAFQELLEEALGSNLKVVVFTQYLGMLDLIGTYLSGKGVGYSELRGDTPDRGKVLAEFSDNPECKVFLCSLLAGGLGIDLTSASVCIHFDRWWNPAKENQATDRLHRIGQTRGVQVFKLQCPGTVEDRIAAIIESKISLSETLIEESPTGLKAFSRKELLEILGVLGQTYKTPIITRSTRLRSTFRQILKLAYGL